MHGLSSELSASGNELIIFADGKGDKEERTFDAAQPFPVYRYGGFKPWRRKKKAESISRIIASNNQHNLTLITDSWKSLELIDQSQFMNVFCLVHGGEIPLQPPYKKAMRIRKTLAKATHIIANSEYTSSRIRPYINKDGRLHIIHPGINIPKQDIENKNRINQLLVNRSPVLITVARLEKRKGHCRLLRLLPRLIKQFPELIYIIVGEGSRKSALESIINTSSLEKYVLFAGTQEEERNAYLSNSDIFVMPGGVVENDVEGFGMAYIEAACFGVPSIACDIGGVGEAVLNGETGLICPPGDQQQLYANILKLLEDNKFRRRLGINAQIRSGYFLWPQQIEKYRKLLNASSIN